MARLDSIIKIPKHTIYLRNKFSIKPGLEGRFFEGQDHLLRKGRPEMELVAAYGTHPLIQGSPAPHPPASMTHIWKLREWESLYRVMFNFSETEWYVKEVESLQSEHQDLLVLTAPGIRRIPRPNWPNAGGPNYGYVYEELRVTRGTKVRFLRHLNWLASQARADDCHITWLCTEITGTPSQISILWRVPNAGVFKSFLRRMTEDAPHANRFAEMMLAVSPYSREYMFPESTEYLDQVAHSPNP